MAEVPEMSFQEGTLVEPFDKAELSAFSNWLKRSGYSAIKFDPYYIKFLQKYHGGSPLRRYFEAMNGEGHVLVRFLNYLPSDSRNSLKQYNAESIWSLTSDRMGMFLIPFAELFAGDYLCFDHSEAGKPRVAVWYHERSKPECNPVTDPVDDSFEEFLTKLHQ